ncbi:hydantoinase B/oxoprolinase family protein [Mycolicibacterium sp. P9-64]|uniref:hydantoinase B/oxoprolinase family protein n=1 Tax=Mycolicibacterium sp. P9-64 TaxID=2024612 RepID=UPI0011EEDAB7|nr:hydantoinase B/oxoprolinase family protein [Mycolicibacterium sp. P9-64]KAA0085598.1 hydantoinase B/oxoprolinase family protein [Mycolicibacterium sp. P9-64]
MSDAADAITEQVVQSALIHATLQMKGLVMRAAYSPLWKEAGDMACALLDKHGRLIAQGPGDIPGMLATIPLTVQSMIDEGCEFQPGDVILHNDPYRGSNHLPDVLMAKPVFVDTRLIGFSAVRGHWLDVGGSTPGSFNAAMGDIHAEGLRFGPVYLYEAGVYNRTLHHILELNLRRPSDRFGDINAQLAGCDMGERRLLEVATRYGVDKLEAIIERFLENSATLMRTALTRIPNGTYEFTDYLDLDGIGGEDIRLHCALTAHDGSVTVDFEGTSPQSKTGLNAPWSVTAAGVYFALKSFVDADTPSNSGTYAPVEVKAPAASAVNAAYPAATIVGSTEVGARVVDVVWGALNKALGGSELAFGNGSSCVVSLSGVDERYDDARQFIIGEVNGAAGGASAQCDGINAMRSGLGNAGTTSAEGLELRFPLRIESHEIVPDTGGAGQFRGGCAVRRTFRLSQDTLVTIAMDRGRYAPEGAAGGRPGAVADASVELHGDVEALPTKNPPTQWPADTLVTVTSAGGGGVGTPRSRPPQAVLADVADGYVSAAAAVEIYGLAEDPLSPSTEGISR